MKSTPLTVIVVQTGADLQLLLQSLKLLLSHKKSVGMPICSLCRDAVFKGAQIYLMVPTGALACVRNIPRKSCACLWESNSACHENKLEEIVGRHHWHSRQELCLEIEIGIATSLAVL